MPQTESWGSPGILGWGLALLLAFCQQYPEGIRKYDYDPSFAIRGLHYDIQKVSG
jgi:hypothetical protein